MAGDLGIVFLAGMILLVVVVQPFQLRAYEIFTNAIYAILACIYLAILCQITREIKQFETEDLQKEKKQTLW